MVTESPTFGCLPIHLQLRCAPDLHGGSSAMGQSAMLQPTRQVSTLETVAEECELQQAAADWKPKHNLAMQHASSQELLQAATAAWLDSHMQGGEECTAAAADRPQAAVVPVPTTVTRQHDVCAGPGHRPVGVELHHITTTPPHPHVHSGNTEHWGATTRGHNTALLHNNQQQQAPGQISEDSSSCGSSFDGEERSLIDRHIPASNAAG